MSFSDWARQGQRPIGWLLAFAVAALIGSPVADILLRPTFNSLQRIDATLIAPVRFSSFKGPHASFVTDRYEGQIERVCLLWGCKPTPKIPDITPGTRVSLWVKGDEIWQLATNDGTVLDFRDSLAAYDRLSVRFEFIMSCLVIVIALLYLWLRSVNRRNLQTKVSGSTHAP